MTIGVLIPTRNNRPLFLDRCKYYMDRQTIPVNYRLIVDYPQKTFPIDLTERYRYGLDILKYKCNVVFLIEDDDWYDERYIETMISKWEQSERPSIFGVGETYFYHIGIKAYWHRDHQERACAFSTMVTSDIIDKIDYRSIDPLLFDMGLWRQKNMTKKTFKPDRPLSIGMKHGRGICGAAGHTAWFYTHEKTARKDEESEWLRDKVGSTDAAWYIEMGKHKEA